jgi:putative MFS transporter
MGRIMLQILGFGGMTLGLSILAIASATAVQGEASLYSVLGFILLNFLMNMGPNATTFILPAELFPTGMRASAHGIATSAAKLGGALSILLIPILKSSIGVPSTLVTVVVAAILGLLVTAAFQVHTTGKTLEELNPGDVL